MQRLASLLRGTVKTVDDLVCLGTQREKDWAESKRRLSQGKDEEQKKKYSGQPNRLIFIDPTFSSQWNKVLQAPIIFIHSYFNDTGSTFSLLKQNVWQRLRKRDEQLTRSAQTFMLANGQSQKTRGKAFWERDIYME